MSQWNAAKNTLITACFFMSKATSAGLVSALLYATSALCSIASANVASGTTSLSATHTFDVAAGPLDASLVALAEQSEALLFLSGQPLSLQNAPALKGNMPLTAALAQLLKNTPYRYQVSDLGGRPRIEILIEKAPRASEQGMVLANTEVIAHFSENEQFSEHLVYDDAVPSVALSAKTLNRYGVNQPADLLAGALNVYGGESRNSGALEPNIRGVQGAGRVPLSIDGTEQALVVWRGLGYGVNNRNYVDPSLISNMRMYKSPQIVRNVHSSVGGAVVINTLGVDDILAEGEENGAQLMLEHGSHTIRPNLNTPIAGQPDSLRITPRDRDDQRLFGGADHSERLAVAHREDAFDTLFAYSLRERGNYFSGKHGVKDYQRKALAGSGGAGDFYRPASEVTNTSLRSESWLAKARVRPDEEQAWELGLRKTKQHNGEAAAGTIRNQKPDLQIQWPLSKVDQQAAYLNYERNTESPWVNLYSSWWITQTNSDTYTAGGSPTSERYDTAKSSSRYLRAGWTLSNQIELTDELDLLLGGRYQYERQRASGELPENAGLNYEPSRDGRREEREFNFNFNWQPVEKVTIEAGARYINYWAVDDHLKKMQKRGSALNEYVTVGQEVKVKRPYEDKDIAKDLESYDAILSNLPPGEAYKPLRDRIESIKQGLKDKVLNGELFEDTLYWMPDSKGRYDRADNPCLKYAGACSVSSYIENRPISAGHYRGSGWSPSASVTLATSEQGRLVLSYSRARRFPDLFEISRGFSSNPSAFSALKPERTEHFELSYIHGLADLFNAERFSDIRLSAYQHRTYDVIDSSVYKVFYNLDRQTLRGVEVQGRYDDGGWFVDMGMAWTLTNKVCDESSAALADVKHGTVSRCVQGGFAGGYLLGYSPPRYSMITTVGQRYWNERVELGARVRHYNSFKNNDFYNTPSWSAFSNRPVPWSRTTLLDAYLELEATENIRLGFSANNITDRFYVDPLSRSDVPAPGRSYRMTLTATF